MIRRDHIRDGEKILGRKTIGKRQRRRLRRMGVTPAEERARQARRKAKAM